MGAVGGYTLDLYCDKAKPYPEDKIHAFGEFPHDFTGHTEAQCKRQARAKGWVFKRDGTVLCPKCSGRTGKREV